MGKKTIGLGLVLQRPLNYSAVPVEELAVLVLSLEDDALAFGEPGRVILWKPDAVVAYSLSAARRPSGPIEYSVSRIRSPERTVRPDIFEAYRRASPFFGRGPSAVVSYRGASPYGIAIGSPYSPAPASRGGYSQDPSEGRPQQAISPYLGALAVNPFRVSRKSQSEIGYGVLGRTWIGTSEIEILDTLQGAAFEEVLLHEQMHQLHPGASEQEIRRLTATTLLSSGRAPIFHQPAYQA